MKYLRYFETVADYQNKRELKYWEPWVSLTTVNDDVNYNKLKAEAHLTLQVLSPGNIVWSTNDANSTKTIKYSKNSGDWVTITSSTSGVSIPVVEGDYVMFEGDNTSYAGHSTFSQTTCQFNVGGNIMSLVNSVDFWTEDTLTAANTFQNLFKNCSGLNFAHDLILPATTLTSYCYASMFENCYNLRSFPELPATNLATYCYEDMFNGCMALTLAPALPATTVYEGSYKEMFSGCVGITQTPALPATTVGAYCYSHMFSGCVGLTQVPAILPAMIAPSHCYEYMFQGCSSITTGPELPATTIADYCYERMFQGCTGLTTITSALPATTVAQNCYSGMFMNCANITNVPELPADTLAANCYKQMFFGCSGINNIKCMATDISATDSTYQWLSGVATNGEFAMSPFVNDTWTYDSINGIPSRWTTKFNNVDLSTPLSVYVLDTGIIKVSTSSRTYNKTMSYRLNDGEIQTVAISGGSGWMPAASIEVNVNKGDVVQFFGDEATYGINDSYIGFSNSTSKFNLGGNIMSLVNSTGYATATSLSGTYNFAQMFRSAKVVHTDGLYLPATSSGQAAYVAMFYSCTSLLTAPFTISLSEFKPNVCEYMFLGCSNLIKGPTIIASQMVGSYCAEQMFANCSSLNQVTCLATSISGSNTTTNWMNGVQTTSGLFIKNASMNNWTTGVNGIPSNWTVESA